jgi:hypothetical protein
MLKNYHAQEIKNLQGGSTIEMQGNNFTAESSTSADNEEVLQDSGIPGPFDNLLFDDMWSGEGLIDLEMLPDDFGLDMFDRTSDRNNIS